MTSPRSPLSRRRRYPTPQEIAAENLDQLLDLVKQGQARASADKAREDRFARDKANQVAALKRLKKRTREERRSLDLKKIRRK